MPRRDAVCAVVDQRGFQAVVLLVAVHVGQPGQLLHLLQQNRAPLRQVLQVVALKRVLILRVALAAADAQILAGLQKYRRSGHRSQLGPQAVDHLVRADFALRRAASSATNTNPLFAGAAAAGKGHHVVHRRIGS